MNECLTGHIDTNENPADFGTKIVPGGSKETTLLENFCMIYVTMKIG